MNKDTENAIFNEVKQYIPKSLTGLVVTIIIFLILNNAFFQHFEWYLNFLLAIVVVAVLNELRLFFKHRNGFKDKNTILILVNSRNINVFNQIKPELKETVEKLVEVGHIEKDVKFKFIDNHVYNQRMCEIYNNKFLEWLYGYNVISILSVNETTKYKRKYISVIPKIKISENFLGEQFKQAGAGLKEFSEQLSNMLELIDTENLFEDMQDLSSNVFLSISFLSALICSIFEFNENNLEISRKIFQEAYAHCEKKSNISKRKKQKYKEIGEKFRNCKIITNIAIIDELIDYQKLKERIEKNTYKTIAEALDLQRLENLLNEMKQFEFYAHQYYVRKEVIEFFKKSPKIKLLNLFDEHVQILKRMPLDKRSWFGYYINRAFINLVNNEFSEAFMLYNKAIKLYNTSTFNKLEITEDVNNIRIFFEIMKKYDDNILYDLSNSINDIFMDDKGKEVENYTNLIKSETYALLPALVRKEFESLRNFNVEASIDDKVKI